MGTLGRKSPVRPQPGSARSRRKERPWPIFVMLIIFVILIAAGIYIIANPPQQSPQLSGEISPGSASIHANDSLEILVYADYGSGNITGSSSVHIAWVVLPGTANAPVNATLTNVSGWRTSLNAGPIAENVRVVCSVSYAGAQKTLVCSVSISLPLLTTYDTPTEETVPHLSDSITEPLMAARVNR